MSHPLTRWLAPAFAACALFAALAPAQAQRVDVAADRIAYRWSSPEQAGPAAAGRSSPRALPHCSGEPNRAASGGPSPPPQPPRSATPLPAPARAPTDAEPEPRPSTAAPPLATPRPTTRPARSQPPSPPSMRLNRSKESRSPRPGNPPESEFKTAGMRLRGQRPRSVQCRGWSQAAATAHCCNASAASHDQCPGSCCACRMLAATASGRPWPLPRVSLALHHRGSVWR